MASKSELAWAQLPTLLMLVATAVILSGTAVSATRLGSVNNNNNNEESLAAADASASTSRRSALYMPCRYNTGLWAAGTVIKYYVVKFEGQLWGADKVLEGAAMMAHGDWNEHANWWLRNRVWFTRTHSWQEADLWIIGIETEELAPKGVAFYPGQGRCQAVFVGMGRVHQPTGNWCKQWLWPPYCWFTDCWTLCGGSGDYLRTTIAHELGHVLGFAHEGDGKSIIVGKPDTSSIMRPRYIANNPMSHGDQNDVRKAYDIPEGGYLGDNCPVFRYHIGAAQGTCALTPSSPASDWVAYFKQIVDI